jgi:hypothetical protein
MATTPPYIGGEFSRLAKAYCLMLSITRRGGRAEDAKGDSTLPLAGVCVRHPSLTSPEGSCPMGDRMVAHGA